MVGNGSALQAGNNFFQKPKPSQWARSCLAVPPAMGTHPAVTLLCCLTSPPSCTLGWGSHSMERLCALKVCDAHSVLSSAGCRTR